MFLFIAKSVTMLGLVRLHRIKMRVRRRRGRGNPHPCFPRRAVPVEAILWIHHLQFQFRWTNAQERMTTNECGHHPRCHNPFWIRQKRRVFRRLSSSYKQSRVARGQRIRVREKYERKRRNYPTTSSVAGRNAFQEDSMSDISDKKRLTEEEK